MKGTKTFSNFSYYFLYQLTNMCFQLLLLPIIINASEPTEIASYFICLSVSTLLSLFVNFGTNITSLVELQKQQKSLGSHTESFIYRESFQIRVLPFMISIVICIILAIFTPSTDFYLILLIPLLGDYLSPLFILLFKNDLKINFQYNLILKLITLIAIFIFRSFEYLPQLSLALQGTSLLVLNILLHFQIARYYKLYPSHRISKAILLKTKEYAPVVGSNLITHLQQSVFLYNLPAVASPLFVAAYGLIDKIIGSVRMLVNTYNTSFFPQANVEYLKGIDHWKNTRFLHNRISTVIALIIAMLFFLFPHYLLQILMLGGSEKSADFIKTGAEIIRAVSLVPLVISLNALNVAEVMMAKLYKQHFMAGLFILFLTLVSSLLAKYTSNEFYLGYYPMFIESSTLVLYLLIVYNYRRKVPILG